MGGNDCCSPTNRCGVREGDCDSNADCMEGLVCGEDNCNDDLVAYFGGYLGEGAEFSSSDDCCTFPNELNNEFVIQRLGK